MFLWFLKFSGSQNQLFLVLGPSMGCCACSFLSRVYLQPTAFMSDWCCLSNAWWLGLHIFCVKPYWRCWKAECSILSGCLTETGRRCIGLRWRSFVLLWPVVREFISQEVCMFSIALKRVCIITWMVRWFKGGEEFPWTCVVPWTCGLWADWPRVERSLRDKSSWTVKVSLLEAHHHQRCLGCEFVTPFKACFSALSCYFCYSSTSLLHFQGKL